MTADLTATLGPWAIRLLVGVGAVYVLVLAVLFFAQTAVRFPAGQVPPAGAFPPGAERLVLRSADGESLHSIHTAPVESRADERMVVLGFGGNGWNAQAAATYLADLYPDADIVTFHYRGYRPSEGKPSAAALLADAPLIYDFVAERWSDRRIVAVWLSVGSGVAAHLARARPLAGLILVTPFDSLEAVAAGHYPWLPVSLLLRHRMNPVDELRGLPLPVAVIAAERDTLIVPERTVALRRGIANIVLDRTISGVGHNDIYQHPAFRLAMGQAMAAIGEVDRQ